MYNDYFANNIVNFEGRYIKILYIRFLKLIFIPDTVPIVSRQSLQGNVSFPVFLSNIRIHETDA